MKYLGLPLGVDPKSEEFWAPVLEKIENRLDGWKKALISKGARFTLSSILICYLSSKCANFHR